MDKFIHIRSPKFPILPGEQEELVNEGTYGRALAEYLQVKLTERGYAVPLVCCEDWGWWVKLNNAPFGFGVCIYCGPERGGLLDLFCTDGDRRFTDRARLPFLARPAGRRHDLPERGAGGSPVALRFHCPPAEGIGF